jgi:hypothetical protein
VRIVGPRMSMGAYNMACLQRASGDIIMLANDDMVIMTPGWDDAIREVDAGIPDKIYLAYGNDLFKRGNLCTFPVLSRRTCQILVEPYPKAYQGAFIDYHLLDIFKRLQHAGFNRIRYLPDVIFDHRHYRTGKAPVDETYLQRGRFDDDPVFFAQTEVRRIAAHRLRCALTGTQMVPLIEQRRAEIRPRSAFEAARHYSRELLFNDELPFKWRSYLWAWFIGRYVAQRMHSGSVPSR